MGWNPDLNTRSPVNGSKENDKKRGIIISQVLKGTSCPDSLEGPLRACISANLSLSTFYFSGQELRGAARRWLHKQWCLQNSF